MDRDSRREFDTLDKRLRNLEADNSFRPVRLAQSVAPASARSELLDCCKGCAGCGACSNLAAANDSDLSHAADFPTWVPLVGNSYASPYILWPLFTPTKITAASDPAQKYINLTVQPSGILDGVHHLCHDKSYDTRFAIGVSSDIVGNITQLSEVGDFALYTCERTFFDLGIEYHYEDGSGGGVSFDSGMRVVLAVLLGLVGNADGFGDPTRIGTAGSPAIYCLFFDDEIRVVDNQLIGGPSSNCIRIFNAGGTDVTDDRNTGRSSPYTSGTGIDQLDVTPFKSNQSCWMV